jgi:hypothetical protein
MRGYIVYIGEDARATILDPSYGWRGLCKALWALHFAH